MNQTPLSQFHPLVARWFGESFTAPTPVQQKTWQAVAGGGHVLLTAPTGSGKTLAAFLWALDRLITGQWQEGCTRVVYISPLKALNNDVQRNLLAPLASLRRLFAKQGRSFPSIRVVTRSGDTSQAERRRMLRHPPEILITTPESLNLLLSSAGGRSALVGIKTVILDEIHAILGTRRGTYLMTAVERLTRLSGEFQRIALSATVRPMDATACFVGGYHLEGPAAAPRYVRRQVVMVSAKGVKQYALRIRRPGEMPRQDAPGNYWVSFAEQIKTHVRANQSTLVFTNSRQLCERLTYLLNRGQDKLLAYSHHGSLSREIRAEVEHNLKTGVLKAIVATGSLELGIDIGALDEVILVQSPASVAQAVQRVGRAGHGVGETSQGTFYPSHAMDIVTAAVLVDAMSRGSIEAVTPMAAPLDVLSQIIVSMCAFETWHPDDLYHFVRTAQPYHTLSRRQFDLVLNLLEGRYEQARLRELSPRIRYDRLDQTLSTRKGALLALYTSGGVIPDRGYFTLRHAANSARIGELDEEFVWEARIGQVFTLGAQNWRIQRITHNDVLVLPASRGKTAPPFWKAENSGRGHHLSDKIACFMEQAEADLDSPDFDERLRKTHHVDDQALEYLKTFLLRQRAHTGCSLPHRHHLVIEFTTLGPGGATGNQVVWHTLWGGRVNRPLAVALEAAWEETLGKAPQIFASNDSLSFVLPHAVEPETLINLVSAGNVEALIHKRLASTGFFGARFRESAARALLLPRQRNNMRMPLWLSRLRAQKLLSAVGAYPDFPILVETWRTCLRDEFDLPALGRLLRELENGEITWTAVHTAYPSPLARNSAWSPINTAMYQTDQGAADHTGGLSDDLLFEITLDPDRRPEIDPGLAEAFASKRQRLAPGYSPDSSEELLDWIKERVAVSRVEWDALMAAMVRDHGPQARAFAQTVSAKLVRLRSAIPDGETRAETRAETGLDLILAREVLPRWLAAFHDAYPGPVTMALFSGESFNAPDMRASDDPDDDQSLTALVLTEWLRFYAPRPAGVIARDLGIPLSGLLPLLDECVEARSVVMGPLIQQGSDQEVCDRENFEILLRLARRAAAPAFKALKIEALPLFLASFQGLTRPGRTVDDLADRMDRLMAWPAPAGLWETDLLPARLAGYRPQWLDQLTQESELRWLGAPGRHVCFYYEKELDLIQDEEKGMARDEEHPQIPGADLFTDPLGRYPFSVLEQNSGLPAAELNERLWSLVWQAMVSNDTFGALRRGVETRFKLPASDARGRETGPRALRGRRASRSAFQHWRAAGRPVIGNWYRLPCPEPSATLLDREERNKERVRLLLDRYGLIFRQLLARELPMLQWKALFRALRLMELSAEVYAGYFFEGVHGLQFISPKALRLLSRDLPRDAVFWLNAVDPASVCGLGLEPLQAMLPKRLTGCHLVYHGADLVIVSHQQAKRLQIQVPAEHEHLSRYLAFLEHMLTRPVQPLRTLRVETVNDLPFTRQSSYFPAFEQLFETVADPKGVNLYRRH